MKNMLSGSHRLRAAAMALLFALTWSGTALAQQTTVTGTVTSAAGDPLPGVTVRVQGMDTRAITNTAGRYTIAAPSNGTLIFALVGQRAVQVTISGRDKIDVTMAKIPYLEQVVVTAYTEQRRADITGAVSSVDVEQISKETGASVLQRLNAAPGITVESSGSPGGRSTVRVRGMSSFQNNDPLYVIDGVAMSDSYVNFLNPDDIASIQVLKDASAASIYGARASNGVVVIETNRPGVVGPPRATLRIRTGIASATRGYDDFLLTSAMDYFQVVKQSYLNAGLPVPTNIYGDPNNPTIPNYIYPNGCVKLSDCPNTASTVDQYGRVITVNASNYAYGDGTKLIMPASTGTNWWKAVFHPAKVGDYNLDVIGGSEDNAYRASFNYFNQDGTARFNQFRRGSIRVNTSFNRKRLNFGENIAVAADRSYGGLPNDPPGYAEDGILGKNILSQPIIPIYDINGNFASGKAVGLGNQSNPLKFAFEQRNNLTKNNRVFGNLFAGYAVTSALSLRSNLGFNVGQTGFTGYTPIFPENSEPSLTNTITENVNNFTDWSWSNTARFNKQIAGGTLALLIGQEASNSTNRFIQGQISALLNTAVNSRYIQDALGDAGTKDVFSTGGRSAILGFFGKADYNLADRYVLSFTVRRDGSSRLGVDDRWGTFPAVGLGWRITNEPFLSGSKLFSDVMLRFGWGVTGNQFIPAGRIVSQFGGTRGDTYYDVTGGNTSVVSGYREVSLGNPNLKWEENRSTNIGADMTLFDGAISLVVDVYRRNTNNLLFDPVTPATAGIAAPPIVNIGKMKNTGIDFSIGHQARSWTMTFTGSHYKNEIVSIDGTADFFYGPIATRYGNQVINQVGHPIGSFYGLIADGLFKDAADVAAHAQQDGAAPGRIKFRDVNGDGTVTLADRTIIGNPHPDFTGGLDLGFRRGPFDLSFTLFGTLGNDIFDVQKEFYVFRNFSTNVRSDLLNNSWTPDKTDAKYPRLDVNDNYSHAISSYYVEDGSYVRMRNIRLGYQIPQSATMRFLSRATVYVQAENLFTITGYDGLDPALPAANVFGPAGDIRDQYRGVDRGSYPSSRTFSVGLTTSF